MRYGRVAAIAASRARTADVIYATATYAAASFASTVTRTPLAAKLVSDPAYERARRYGLFSGTLEDFQAPGSKRVEALKHARTRALGRAAAIVVPSGYLAAIAARWRLDDRRISVLPNPAPDLTVVAAPLERGTFTFVGRLTRQKALDVAIAAIGRVPEARLIVIGDGPDRERLEGIVRDSAAASPGRVPRRAPASRGPCDRRRLGGGVADERLGELPSLGCRGPLCRGAGSLDGRGWRA